MGNYIEACKTEPRISLANFGKRIDKDITKFSSSVNVHFCSAKFLAAAQRIQLLKFIGE